MARRQVLAATLVFCAGVALVRPVLAFLAYVTGRGMPRAADGDPLWVLLAVVVAATGLYLFLREEEGDFRALITLTIGLFGITEVVGLAVRFGAPPSFANSSALLRVATSVYGLLALCATLAERPERPDPARRILAVAAVCICAVCFLGTAGSMVEDRPFQKGMEIASVAFLGLNAAFLFVSLFLSRAPRFPRRGPAPSPSAPLPPRRAESTDIEGPGGAREGIPETIREETSDPPAREAEADRRGGDRGTAE